MIEKERRFTDMRLSKEEPQILEIFKMVEYSGGLWARGWWIYGGFAHYPLYYKHSKHVNKAMHFQIVRNDASFDANDASVVAFNSPQITESKWAVG